MSPIESETHLCRHCGLCCAGVLFSRVEVYPEEKEKLSTLGLPIYEDQDGHYFNLHCPRFRYGVCGIYENQPKKCGEYRCQLLKRLMKKEIELSDALAIVDNTKDMSNSLANQLDKLYSPDWNKTYIKDLIRQALKTDAKNSHLIINIRNFLKQLNDNFEQQSLLKYIPFEEIGFGVVEDVSDSKGKIYAKKTFYIDPSAKYSQATIENERKRFIQEGHFLHSLSHKNIVPVLDYNSQADPPYFNMPKAVQSFATDLLEHPKHIRKYFHAVMDILSGLEEIHSMGICHLDLKPSNVLRFKNKKAPDFYAICDFGCMIDSNSPFSDLDKHKTKMNPNDYSAPEIVKDLSKGTVRSDIYSLGCILHDLMGIEDREPSKEISETVNFGSIILKCSRKDPSLRFGSVKELRDALISLNDIPIETSSPDGAKCIKILNYKKRLSKNQWIKIIKFVSDELYSPDGPLVLRKITLDRIQEVVKHYPRQASKLGITVAQWTRDADFEFAECDGLSNRLEIFIKNCNVQVQKECLAAMLYMGSRHNRWYVERKFIQLVGKKIKLALARSLVAEFKGNRQDACEAIKHLKKSSLLNIDNLHPLLAQAFIEIS